MFKINKALDYGKLLQDQAKGKLLKKQLEFPLYVGIKWDGNAVVVIKTDESIKYYTSGNHEYTHTEGATIFDGIHIPTGYAYIAERIGTDGKLGDRVNCNLRGPRGNQTSTGHSYKVHDMIPLDDYYRGRASELYADRRRTLRDILDGNLGAWASDRLVTTIEEAERFLKEFTRLGYEGLMLKDPRWLWKNTKSRKPECAKWKKRNTADLLCMDVTEGEGKYEGMIGSLMLQDSAGREVFVGSGLSDAQRALDRNVFIGEVVEIEYEQLLDTYIQPTFITLRLDKSIGDID